MPSGNTGAKPAGPALSDGDRLAHLNDPNLCGMAASWGELSCIERLSPPQPTFRNVARTGGVRWPRSAGQVGGEDKLLPGSDYAASFRLDAVAGACPGHGVERVSLYASSGVRPASEEWGRCVL